MDSCSVCVAGAYVWLRIFMLARDLGAKDWVRRVVYSGDISREKSCSGRWLTRRFLPSGLAMEGSRSESLCVVPAGRDRSSRLLTLHDCETAVNMRLGYLECDETPSK